MTEKVIEVIEEMISELEEVRYRVMHDQAKQKTLSIITSIIEKIKLTVRLKK
jgi:hypothetical protein